MTGIREEIVEAGLETLKTKGFVGASARSIASTGGFNQALIFYHFGSVRNVLLAALDLVSERRMLAYSAALEDAMTVPELVAMAQEIYRDDLDSGYVTVLAEMVAGASTDPDFGREVVSRILPWLELTREKLDALLAGSPLAALVPSADIAFAIIALYLGVDMLSHLDGDSSRGESLLALLTQAAPVMQLLLTNPAEQRSTAQRRGSGR